MERNEIAITLKSIVKELHEMNKKLDRLGQASIFDRNVGSYNYEEDINVHSQD